MAGETVRLYLTIDNKGAIVALKEVGAQSEQTSRKIHEDNARTASSFEQTKKSTEKLHSHVSALGGAVGLGGLAFGIADVVKNGMAWQRQQAALQVALRNTHMGASNTLDVLSTAAEKGSMSGGFAAPEELQALTQFVTLTHSSTEALKLNRAATNLARGTGLGYAQTSRMMGQVLTGNVGRLQRYLGIIQPVKSNMQALTASHKLNIFQLELQAKALGKSGPLWLKQQLLMHGLAPAQIAHAQLLDKQATAQMVLARIQERYGGQTAAFSRTAAGGMSNLRNSLEVMTAQLGSALLPALQMLIGVLSDAARWMERHKTLVLVLVGVIAGLTVGVVAVDAATAAWGAAVAITNGLMGIGGAAIAVYRTAVLLLGLSFEGMGVAAGAAWVLATGGVILLVAGIALIITHFHQFKQIVGAVWSWFKHAASDVAASLAKAFGPPINWIIGKIKWIVDKVLWIPKHLASIGSFFLGSGGSSQAQINRMTDAQIAAANRQIGWTGKQIHRTSGPSGAGLNTVSPSSHPVQAGGDHVIHVHAHLDGRQIAESTARYSMRKVALS